jgi:hypothetical protein
MCEGSAFDEDLLTSAGGCADPRRPGPRGRVAGCLNVASLRVDCERRPKRFHSRVAADRSLWEKSSW